MAGHAVAPAIRVWRKIDRRGDNDCWPWLGGKTDDGYPRFYIVHTAVRVHRFIYELLVGPIPDGFSVDHTCHTAACSLTRDCPHRSCCNPKHLEAVTQKVNVLRGNGFAAQHAKKTHCPKGHPYEGRNLRVRRGSRECRQCGADRMRKKN